MNNQTLGTIAMICAPALLIEGLLVRGGDNAVITGITSMVFMVGWICSNIGMQRMQATGIGGWGHAVLIIQLVGLVLAFLFGFFEATGLLGRDSIIYLVTDVAWPLSMLWMVVVGVTVIRAKRLSGWRRFVPLLCPFWLLIGGIVGTIFGGAAGSIVGFGYAAVLWVLLGNIVRSNSQQPVPTPRPSVQ